MGNLPLTLVLFGGVFRVDRVHKSAIDEPARLVHVNLVHLRAAEERWPTLLAVLRWFEQIYSV